MYLKSEHFFNYGISKIIKGFIYRWNANLADSSCLKNLFVRDAPLLYDANVLYSMYCKLSLVSDPKGGRFRHRPTNSRPPR